MTPRLSESVVPAAAFDDLARRVERLEKAAEAVQAARDARPGKQRERAIQAAESHMQELRGQSSDR